MPHLERERRLGDEVRSLRTGDGDAEEQLRRLVRHHLHEPLGIVDRDGAPERRERELADNRLVALLLRLLLGEADRRHLRIGEDAGRHRDPVSHRRVSGDDLGRNLALLETLVGEERRAGEVADAVDGRHARLHPLVHLDEALRADLHPRRLEAHALAVRAEAHRDEHLVTGDGLLLPADLNLHHQLTALALEPLRLGAHVDGRLALAETLLNEPHGLGIDAGQDRGQRLHHRHLRPELRVDGPELEPDDAAADDHEPLRDLGQVDGLLGAPYVLAVELEAGDLHGPSAGRDDEGRRLDARLLPAVGRLNLDRARTDEAGGALQHLDPFPFSSIPTPLTSFFTTAFLNSRSFATSTFGSAVIPRIARAAQVLHQVRGRDERLRRDTPPVEADAAQGLLLHQRRLLPQLRQPDGGHVAARACADHDRVEALRRHARSPPEPWAPDGREYNGAPP